MARSWRCAVADHITRIDSDGSGMCDHYFARCSCGWVGEKYAQYEDYAYTCAMKTADDHIREALLLEEHIKIKLAEVNHG
jgi:hypothetical protein